MAFGNYSPYYRNYYGQPAMNEGYQIQMPGQAQNNLIWVLDENEAAAFFVQPNNTAVMFHKSKPIMFIKSANAQGIPSLRTFNISEINAPTEDLPKGAPSVSVEQFNELQAKFEDLSAKVESLAKPKTTKEAK